MAKVLQIHSFYSLNIFSPSKSNEKPIVCLSVLIKLLRIISMGKPYERCGALYIKAFKLLLSVGHDTHLAI